MKPPPLPDVIDALVALGLIEDGAETVELFHATSTASAEAIERSGLMTADGAGCIYLSSSDEIADLLVKDLDVDSILTVRVPVADLSLSVDWREQESERVDFIASTSPHANYPVEVVGRTPVRTEADPRSDAISNLRVRLTELTGTLGLTFARVTPDTPGGRLPYLGQYNPVVPSLVLADHLDAESEVKAWAHELCHVCLHPPSPTVQERSEDDERAEEQIVNHATAIITASFGVEGYRDWALRSGIPAVDYPSDLPTVSAQESSSELAMRVGAALDDPTAHPGWS